MIRRQQTGKALGSVCVLTILVNNQTRAEQILKALWAQMYAFEARFSRFIPSSELSACNMAAGSLFAASAPFRTLLETALSYSQLTHGLYNPLSLPALQQAGYQGSWPTVGQSITTLDFRNRQAVASPKDVLIQTSGIVLPASAALDFGGIGKGYLLDQLADFLNTQHVKDYCLSLGGDIICSGQNIEESDWKIAIAEALHPESAAKYIVNHEHRRLAVATSGITKRRGTNWHHIIDPRTAKPADTDVLTASVVSDSATHADVLAKCLVIGGSKQAAAFGHEHKLSNALLQLQDGTTMKLSSKEVAHAA